MRKIIKHDFGGVMSSVISDDMLSKINKNLGFGNINISEGLQSLKPLGDSKSKKTADFGNSGILNSNAKFGNAFSMGKSVLDGINTKLVGNEATGKTAESLNKLADTGASIASNFNPLGGLANSAGKLVGNLIGGTKDRVAGSGSAAITGISSALSFAGPIGMAAGAVLNLINGIGGKRAMKLADQSSEFGSGFSGSQSFVHDTVGKYSNKKAGLFDFGFYGNAMKNLSEAKRQQGTILDIQDDDRKMDLNSAGEYITANNQMLYSGQKPQLILSKHGMKFPELDNARKLISSWSTKSTETQEPQKYQLGGKMNLIPEGALHARKHNLSDINPELKDQITNKGIPVVIQSDGEVTQTAEIEKDEWTLRKEFTDELESLYKLYQKDQSDEAAIKAGKLICYELLKNTDDRSGLIKSVK